MSEFSWMKIKVETWQFNEMADLPELATIDEDPEGPHVVYVFGNNTKPEQFGRATLFKTTLTDGSFVFDLQLS